MARGLVPLAMLAALLGAPLPVSAAVNELAAAEVSPTAGTVTTVFVMRVAYDGGFPATAVIVTVAGAPRPMSLEHGTASTGTWVLATSLPAGTWPLSFAATVVRGSSPSLVGPTVSVAEAPAATPTSPPSSPAATSRSTGPGDPPSDDPASADGPDPGPGGNPSQAPRSSAAPAQAPASTGDGAGSQPPGSASEPDASRAADGGPGDAAVAGSSVASTAGPRPGTVGGAGGERAAASGGAEHDATSVRTALPAEPDGLVGMVLAIGLVGVAAVALVGTLVLVAGRRRQDPEEPAALATGAAPDVTAAHGVVTRRMLLRARLRLADDPILSALGVEEQMQARRNRRARRLGADDPPGPEA